ncbi:iron-siderophore ABC transporter substrate-binding protein [Ornithinimicrobium ciconiae]|uniref:Iron-siderophore ABC transporter substrate-binding protein n=1 Tax=Ornithinimicrobium ciconiae TaxID=2594265 RepID=A0A516G674_9MICO|nr:iron-siderophore ABC transporter substrate-binding protein [Ornithinimicrobium ciconiae]QDO86972.1 iron-siderophore ABC transporter substrate-binding protein [Ornithinimicrobium ciconiae]
MPSPMSAPQPRSAAATAPAPQLTVPRRTRALLGVCTLGLVLVAGCSTGPTDDTATTDNAGPTDETGGTSDTDSTSAGSGDSAEDSADAAGETGAAQFPVTIEHAFGETTIESDPQRVATVGWSDQDTVVALGEVPVGSVRISWGGNDAGSTDWFDAAVTELGSDPGEVTRYDDADGIPTDEIAQLAPDLIIGTNSGMTQEEYDALSKIAPVVAFPETAWGTPWRDSVEMVGQAIGRDAEADAVLAELEVDLDTVSSEHPELAGTSMAWTWYTATDLSTIGVYTATDLRPQLMHEFGMVDASKVTELTEANPGTFSANLSSEQADTLDADVLFFYVEDESQVDQLVNEPLIGSTPALANGSFVALTDMQLMSALSSPTPLTIPVVLEEFVPLASEAAEKVQ